MTRYATDMTLDALMSGGLPEITPIPLPDVAGNRAVLFLRLSEDELARGTDVDEALLLAELDKQRQPCLEYCASKGLEVVGEYVEIDVSAYQPDEHRPGFESLLADAPLDVFDYVVPTMSDRVYRRLSDLTRVTDELARFVRITPVLESEVNLTTSAGILQAQILGAVAEFESRHKGERVALKAKSRAKDERRTVSAKRPVGWTWADPCPRGDACEHRRRCKSTDRRPRFASRAGLVPDPVEAPLLVQSYRRVADGESLKSVHRGLWVGMVSRPEALRRALLAGRHAGLVEHKGTVVAEAADGQRIVEVELWQTVKGILEDPSRRTNPGRPAGTYLSGVLRCGACNGPLNATNEHGRNGNVFPVYDCSAGRHVQRRRATVDEAVLGAVRDLLVRDADALRVSAKPDAGPLQRQAVEKVRALQDRLATYAELGASGAMDAVDVAATTKIIRADLAKALDRAIVAAGKPATAKLLRSPDVGAAWDDLVDSGPDNVDAVRRILRELIERIDVEPGQRGYDGVRIRWDRWVDAD